MIRRPKTSVVVSLMSLALLTAGCAGSTKGTSSGTTPTRSATPLVSATDAAGDANFAVRFPAAPTHRLVHPKDAQGAALAATSAKLGGAEYDVFDLSPATLTPGKETQGLTYEAKKFYSNFACTVGTNAAPALSGHPVIAFSGTCGSRHVLGFIVGAKAHLYFVDVETAPATASSSEASAFLASFTLHD